MSVRLLVLAAAAVIMSVVLVSDRDEITDAERSWLELETLQVSRINDAVALRLLPASLGDPDIEGVVRVEDEVEPDWVALEQACLEIEGLLPEMRRIATSAPRRYSAATPELLAYADALERFVATCVEAIETQDWEVLAGSAAADLFTASDALDRSILLLPVGIGCPEDTPNPPETCALGPG